MNDANRPGNGQTALITGASGGIGAEFARVFARHGFDLVLVARSIEKLDKLAGELSERFGVSVKTIRADLASPYSPQQVFDETTRLGIAVDVLVNNAGYSLYGSFLETDRPDELDMIQVNVVTPTHLTKLYLPGMVERKRGRILNMSSNAAFQPGPYMAVYYASKAYVLSLSEAIASELEGTGVTVTALCPGPTHSGFQDRAGMHESRLMRLQFLQPQRVAREGYDALMAGRAVAVPGGFNRVAATAIRLMPRGLAVRVSKMTTKRM